MLTFTADSLTKTHRWLAYGNTPLSTAALIKNSDLEIMPGLCLANMFSDVMAAQISSKDALQKGHKRSHSPGGMLLRQTC